MTGPLPWYVARACGLTAWALAWAAVVVGLALSTRALGSRPRAPWLNDLHRFLGGLTLVFVGVHVGALLVDRYVPFTPEQVLVPFATHWKPGAVAWGIAAFYLLVAVEVTSLAMRRIPRRLWKGIHLSSYAMAVGASLHLLTAGTDAHLPLVRWSVLALLAGASFFIFYRVSGPGRRASVAGGSAARGRQGSEAHGHRGAAGRGALHGQVPAARLRGAPGDVEPEAGRARAAGASRHRRLGVEAGALVADGQPPAGP